MKALVTLIFDGNHQEYYLSSNTLSTLKGFEYYVKNKYVLTNANIFSFRIESVVVLPGHESKIGLLYNLEVID